MHIRTVLGVLGLAATAAALAADATSVGAESETGTVYITDLGSTSARQTLGLRVESNRQTAIPGEIDFRCTILSPAEYDDVTLTLDIGPEGGAPMYHGALVVNLVKGEQAVVLQWPADAGLADGEYSVRINAERPNGAHMASARLLVRKLSYAMVADTVDRASEALSDLEAHVAQLGEESFTPPVLNRLAIAHETIAFARDARAEKRWPIAYDRAREVLDASTAVRAGLTFAALAPERFAPSPVVVPHEVSIHGGAVQSAGTPVFLFGVRLSLEQTAYVAELARFGINAVVVELSPADVLLDADAVLNLHDTLGPVLGACSDCGMAVALQLEPQKMAGWALDQWPEMSRSQFPPFFYDVTHPRALDVLERFYRVVGDYADREPRIAAISLADAPRFRISDEPMRRGFAVHLSTHYSSIVELNLAWQSRLPSFEDVPVRWDWEKPPYQAHLQRYHRDQVTGFFSWILNAYGGNARDVPLMFTAPGSMFEIGSAKDGIDVELLNGTFDASGSDFVPDGPPGGLALPFPDAQMQIEVLRSLNPDKPVLDLGGALGRLDAETLGASKLPLRERARLWQSAMAGADMCVTPLDSLFDITADELSPHDTQNLTGFISGGQTLNRLAPIVQRFQAQPDPIAILWSDSSRMLDNGAPYLPSLRRAYEGAACYGMPVRFITERQIRAGELDTVTILVLPAVLALADDAFEALDRYVGSGGRLVSTGTSIPYDAFGRSRSLRLQASPLTKLVRGRENAGNYLLALDAAVEASDLDEIPRAIDNRGYPVLGVISRFLADDEGGYLYLCNLLHDAQTVHLPAGSMEGRDLIDGRPVRFPLQLDPLDPMLIELTMPEARDSDAETSEPADAGPPTAIVEPVNKDE